LTDTVKLKGRLFDASEHE